MEPGDIIAIIVIALALGGALFYIIKAKKSGKKCIGCPNGCCGCSSKANGKKADGSRTDGSRTGGCCCGNGCDYGCYRDE